MINFYVNYTKKPLDMSGFSARNDTLMSNYSSV